MKFKPWKIVRRVLPPIIDAVGELIDAAHPDSPGGKRITPAERDAVVERFVERMRVVVLKELGA